MSFMDWILLAFFLLFLVLVYIGFRYPRGKLDWPFDKAASSRILIAAFLFVVIIGLLYLVTQSIPFPPSMTILQSVIVFFWGLFVALGILFPEGMTIADVDEMGNERISS